MELSGAAAALSPTHVIVFRGASVSQLSDLDPCPAQADIPSPQLPDRLDVWQATLAWQPTPAQSHQFQHLYAQILVANRQFNLTRITEPDDFLEKHLWDSLRGIKDFLSVPALRVIDLGTGGGFPGIPIAIACPTWHLTLVDSTRKKMTFVQEVTSQLGLTQVKTLADRIEAVGQQPSHREQYDLAVIRAVAAAPICAEYALPMLRVGGTAILYRGQWTEAEATSLTQAAQCLGGEVGSIDACQTPLTHSERHLVPIRKIAPTPQAYPRAIGVPTQHPL